MIIKIMKNSVEVKLGRLTLPRTCSSLHIALLMGVLLLTTHLQLVSSEVSAAAAAAAGGDIQGN
jgi:hypothetical protein